MYNSSCSGGYGNCSPSYGTSNGYGAAGAEYSQNNYSSDLEQVVMNSIIEPQSFYNLTKQERAYILPNYTSADTFLRADRPDTKFFTNKMTEELMAEVNKACNATIGQDFPQDTSIVVCDEAEFAKAHTEIGGTTTHGVLGFSLNSNGNGINRIFVKENHLDQLMLTIGHELGHVLTATLNNMQDEEAKAFAFSIAWMDAILKNNIAGLQKCIAPNPARNGLHDVAFNFVQQLIESGNKAIAVFSQLSNGIISIIGG